MKKVELFYLENCPHCKNARSYMEELMKEPTYANIEIKMYEETVDVDYANAHDYYYVPTFYIDDKKVFEGSMSKEDVETVLKQCL